jgi:DNA-binding NtrC family response regulator
VGLRRPRDEDGWRDNKEIDVKDQLEALVSQMYKAGILYSEAVREFKKRFLLTVLEENHGNQCKAARELGMHRNTLSRTINELELDVATLRNGMRRPPRAARPATPSVVTPVEKKAAGR